MKICIITYAFYTSSIPLARYLAVLGHEVDLLCLTGSRSSDHFTVNLSGYDLPDGFVPDLKLSQVISTDVLEYLEGLHDFKIFVFSKNRRNLYIKYFISIIKLSRFLKSRGYEIVHFIGQNEIFLYLSRLIKLPKIYTFHEVLIRTGRVPSRYRLVDYVSKRKHNVILHSSNTKNDYLEKFHPENRTIKVIRFGLFETYRLFPVRTFEEPGTLLYYGIILPYKGLEFLLEAFRIIKKEIPDLKLIVAGRGTLYFERSLLDQEGIELINRTISEEELANLNMRASIVVCPYTSASQSGIPVTSFVFNKPVLATRVDGITEYVIHEETGILVPPGDSKSLADGIRRLVNDDSLRNRIIDNIKQMNKKSNSDWIAIAESTLDVYLNEMQN